MLCERLLLLGAWSGRSIRLLLNDCVVPALLKLTPLSTTKLADMRGAMVALFELNWRRVYGLAVMAACLL